MKPAEKASRAQSNAQAKSVVRVDLDRIERLVNLVGELVINQAMLSQSLEKSGLSPHSDAMSGLEEFQRLTRDIQDSVMMIRAQPVKSLFQRMSRIVRESSAAVGKDVRLHTFGEGTEVDKTVIERLADPLTHMIRNAVDHGLEDPEKRQAAGKPAQGRVNLTAAHRSGRVVIEVSDDGAGINRPRVLQIAIDKGLIPADVSLSDSEIDNLLFLPGFSTASVVSDLSGRGVGMDVVRTAIQALGGRITITSNPGEGTTFSISLPLTLAVLDGMVIKVAGETLVLPLNLVVETLTLGPNDVQMVRPGRNVIEVRSGFVPLFDLGAALGYRPLLEDFDEYVVLLIAQEDGSSAALVIDNIIDQRQVVIKGLDESFYRAPGIAAATILGDGQIALILDPTDIISTPGAAPTQAQPAQQLGLSA
ncbi:chemotaxis protein CheA [Sulfitobacter pacificus]|uniref:chemotaxis protein CheA n=1 Tax=Sulfitobacter pacificus TaxID=1499314 RepID=UPI003608F912